MCVLYLLYYILLLLEWQSGLSPLYNESAVVHIGLDKVYYHLLLIGGVGTTGNGLLMNFYLKNYFSLNEQRDF